MTVEPAGTADAPKITVFLADDSLIVREGVRALLAAQPDLDVVTGGSILDPAIVHAIVQPARAEGELDEREEQLLRWIAEGRPVKAIATSWNTTAPAANDAIEELFLKLAKEASAGRTGALR